MGQTESGKFQIFFLIPSLSHTLLFFKIIMFIKIVFFTWSKGAIIISINLSFWLSHSPAILHMPGFVWHWNVFFTNFTPGYFMLFWWLRKFWLPMHSGGNLGVRLGLELDKNIFKSIQKYFKSIQKYLTHTNSGLAHPKLFGSKYFWYVKYFYSYMSLFGQKLKFCFLCLMKTNFWKKLWKHKCLP